MGQMYEIKMIFPRKKSNNFKCFSTQYATKIILSAPFYLHNWGNMLIFAAELPKY